MPWLLYIYIFFSDFLCFDMSLLLLTVTLRGVSSVSFFIGIQGMFNTVEHGSIILHSY